MNAKIKAFIMLKNYTLIQFSTLLILDFSVGVGGMMCFAFNRWFCGFFFYWFFGMSDMSGSVIWYEYCNYLFEQSSLRAGEL